MKVGFIGLGNAGGKLAGSLLRNGFDLTVLDLDNSLVNEFIDRGASSSNSPREMAELCDVVITCLPSPKACSEVMESEDGVIAGLKEGKIWLEMSTTDEAEIRRIGAIVESTGALPIDCPCLVVVIEQILEIFQFLLVVKERHSIKPCRFLQQWEDESFIQVIWEQHQH